MVVLRDGEGSVYGGYADGAWPAGSSGTYLASTAAFLFCLASSKAPAVAPFKMPLNGTYNQPYAIYGGSDQGAAFGGAHDLYVLADGHVNCAIGNTYTAGPTGATISTAATVAVVAMEVWQLADA